MMVANVRREFYSIQNTTVHVWGIRGQLQLKGWCDDARTGIVGRAAELGSCRAADRGDQL